MARDDRYESWRDREESGSERDRAGRNEWWGRDENRYGREENRFGRQENRYGRDESDRWGQGRSRGREEEGWGGGYGSREGSFGGSSQGGYGGSKGQFGGQEDYGSQSYGSSQQGFGGRPESSQGRGRFAGRGPKGYTRSDERIKEDVSEELTRHGEIDASEIEVQVMSGEITLTGTVPDRNMKRIAEDIAERCSGVKEVHNQIRVNREAGQGQEQNRFGQGLGQTQQGQEKSRTGSKL